MEILLTIFEFIEKVDLKHLRLVSRTFNIIAPEILFRSVNASPHTEDLKILQLISEHSIFRHHVQEVVYFDVYFHCPFKIAKDSTLQPDVDTHASIIATALTRMPKLRRLILKNHWLPPKDDPIYEYSDEDIKKDTIYGPRTSRHFLTTEKKPYAIPIRCSFNQPENYDYGFKVMRNAITISNYNLQPTSSFIPRRLY